MNPRKNLDDELAGLRSQLEGTRGKTYWRTLEELADREAFQELMRQEFPEQAAVWPDEPSRRAFLTLMGASLGLAGLGGCSVRPAPAARMVPYVKAPEEIIPGKPLFYATAMTRHGRGVGLLVESHLGRPTKVEGNPDHPASRGATDAYHQASVLTLYDPDRSASVTRLGLSATWDDAFAALREAARKQRDRRGAGLRILSETVVSPTLGRQAEELLKEFSEAKWHQYEPLARDEAFRAARFAFGEPVATHHDFRKADVVLCLDADFLGGDGDLGGVADFTARRRVRTSAEAAGQARMNRLYVVETALTCTGAKADHRLALPPGEIERLARAVAARLGVVPGDTGGPNEKWVAAVAKDLEQHRGRCVVLAGDRQPVAVHLLAHAINDRLGNVGKTVIPTAPVEARPADQSASLRELVEDMRAGRVEALLILGGNPVYTAPADLNFAERLGKVPLRFHLSLYQDETSRLCQWHLPEAHYLEAWSDTRAYDGTASIAQPLIEPLYHGRSAHELLSVLLHGIQTPSYEIVRDHWRRQRTISVGDFEDFWQSAVHDGVVPGTRFPAKPISLRPDWRKHLDEPPGSSRRSGYDLVFQADPTLHDGLWANNGWLQELPKPMTHLCWGNVALVSPATAKEIGVGLGSYAHGGEHGGFHQPVVELTVGERGVRAPVWVMPGHADGCITVYLGHGRAHAGKVGDGVGFDAYRLRTAERPWFVPGLSARKTGEQQLVACTQQHHLMENRDLVRSATLTEYRQSPRFASAPERKRSQEEGHGARTPLTMYESRDYPGHRWGMAIDLTACTGCSACVVACQAENNIPVVGKEQVAAGREMHWLRIDQYHAGPADAPTEFHLQPVPCMHCEQAPCEYVCPTEATVHSADGLNDMVYQRCVGTRFCSNNCPYKVRRFNFFGYADFESVRKMQYNPDVTVRSRGVMEKCSYCVQRIRAAEIGAQTEGRPLRDGEILTACQAVCPAEAIVFGDIGDPKSRVKQWKESPLHYGLLTELNTKPRTTYLAALRNPNPELEA